MYAYWSHGTVASWAERGFSQTLEAEMAFLASVR